MKSGRVGVPIESKSLTFKTCIQYVCTKVLLKNDFDQHLDYKDLFPV